MLMQVGPILIPWKLITELVAVSEAHGQTWARWCTKKWGFLSQTHSQPSLFPAARASSRGTGSFPICSPGRSAVAPGSSRASCKHMGDIPYLQYLVSYSTTLAPQGAKECSEAAKKLLRRETYRAPGFRANFLLFFFVCFSFERKKAYLFCAPLA